MKKVLAAILILISVFALCACGNNSSDNNNDSASPNNEISSKANNSSIDNSIIQSKWVFDSYVDREGNGSLRAGEMELKDDYTFYATAEKPNNYHYIFTGTYRIEGEEIIFTLGHRTELLYDTVTTEKDLSSEFTGSIDGDTLTLSFTWGKYETVIFKRT